MIKCYVLGSSNQIYTVVEKLFKVAYGRVSKSINSQVTKDRLDFR